MFSSSPSIRPRTITQGNIKELFYITRIENLASILEHGLLSHRRAHRLSGVSDISNHGVQDRRKRKFVERPSGTKAPLSIHQYVNLYLTPHNAMMAVRSSQHRDLCVLRISNQVLTYPDVVLTTANAATARADFMAADDFELSEDSSRYLTVNKSMLYNNQYAQEGGKEKHKQVRQAECLVPYEIGQNLIGGIFVSCAENTGRVQEILNAHRMRLTAGVIALPGMFFANDTFAPLPAFKPLSDYNMPIYVDDDSVESSEELQREHGDTIMRLKHTRRVESSPVIVSDTSGATSSTNDAARDENAAATSNTASTSTNTASTSTIKATADGVPANFKFHPGEDLLKGAHQALINTVNCKGVMGKGIALSFKNTYPRMFENYASECQQGKYKLGEPHIVKEGDKFIVNFPTKGHWRHKSRLPDIEKGLIKLNQLINENRITSIALPPLGCGNGGLDWNDVYPLVKKHLADCGATVAIYAENPVLKTSLAMRAK